MQKITARFFTGALLGAGLLVSTAVTPATLRADDHDNARTYHDKDHNDEHHWDNHEDQAYRVWVKENHRKYRGFSKLKENDQRAYWDWRHQHSDAQLNINIR